MTQAHKVVAIIGSTGINSRTKALVEAIVSALSDHQPIAVEYVELATLAADVGAALSKDDLSPRALAALNAIESSDLLIASTPVYKGSFAGLFKHLIDFIDPEALVARPVLLAATGGSDRHALVVDQALRPLFSFFRAQTVPSAVYASQADFEGYTLRSAPVLARVDEAARQAAQLLRAARALPQVPLKAAA